MKRGQAKPTGSAAAAVVGIITILLIFYILFLPPAEREALLEGENVTLIKAKKANESLLVERPGRLAFFEEERVDHTIPDVFLIETKEAQVFERVNPFVVRNGWFTTQPKVVGFRLADVENTGNVFASFEAGVRKGRLRILLNGVTVFEGTPTTSNVPPVELDKTLLRDDNRVVFSVSNTGLAFWRVNTYEINKLQIIGDITDVSRQESINFFSIPTEEYTNIDTARLTFYPVCEQQKVGRLDVVLNNRNIFSAVPNCETFNAIELLPQDLNAGRNVVVFRAARGSYRIEQIKARTELKEVKSYITYFEVTEETIREIERRRREVNLTIEFVDDREDKTADINLNGRFIRLDQKDAIFRRDISNFLVSGNNYLEIKPLTDLNIVEIEITEG